MLLKEGIKKSQPSDDLTLLLQLRYLRRAMLTAVSARVVFLASFSALSTCSVIRQKRHMT